MTPPHAPGQARARPRPRRRRARLSPILLTVGVVAVAASGCRLGGHPGTTTSTRVLGEPDRAPPVLGQPAPGGTGGLTAVSCATAQRCWAVGVVGGDPTSPPGVVVAAAATTDGGRSWAAQRATGITAAQLSAVSCPTATACLAVGSSGASSSAVGVVMATRDGTTWSSATTPVGALAVTSVACVSPRACTAVVAGGSSTWSAGTTDFARTWQQHGDLPAGFQAGNDLTCTPGGTCLVAGFVPTSNGHGQGAVALSTDGGATWTLAHSPPGVGVLETTSCPSTSVCLAAGTTSTTVSDVVPAKGTMLRSTDGGHTWTLAATPPVDEVYGMDCPSSQVCAMVGTDWIGSPPVAAGAAALSTDGGSTFRSAPTAYTPLPLTGLVCPTSTHCIAVGGDTVATVTAATPTGTKARG